MNASAHHLTLKFIGEVDDERRDRIASALESVAHPAFHIRIQGLSVFPGFSKPRVLVVGVAREPELMDLQRAVEELLADLDIPVEPRPYRPHITIARLREENADRVRKYLSTHRNFSLPPILAREFSLYASQTKPSGAVYDRLATYDLARQVEGSRQGDRRAGKLE